jgi:dUTP pyrophosphatase
MAIAKKEPSQNIVIKYHGPYVEKIQFIDGANWIDLRAAEDVNMLANSFAFINLGVSMKLPDGYEAHLVPRSSTYKKYGILQVNGMGIIDNTYCGDMDIWMMPVYATRATYIPRNDRICQFRIMKIQPPVTFTEVEFMEDKSRGGFGSTGTNEIKK